MTYSFISPSAYDKVRMPADSPKRESIRILNPLGEDTSIMRTTAVPSMLEVLARNEHFHNTRAKLYELARIYGKRADSDMADESKDLILGSYGSDVDFFALKGDVEVLLESLQIKNAAFSANPDRPAFHPGRCADVSVNGRVIGTLGEVHPQVSANFGAGGRLYAARLSFDALLELQQTGIAYCPLPKYPAVSRDLALVCDAALPVARLEKCIRQGSCGLVRDVTLFDIYTGAPVPVGKKSVAFSLRLRSDSHTLTDAEADQDVAAILERLKSELDAVLR